MTQVNIDPKVLELGKALNEGYTSLAAKERMTTHASNTRTMRKAQRRAVRQHLAAQRGYIAQ